MTKERFCQLCGCDGKDPVLKATGRREKNWSCPLLGGENICETCCWHEVSGGTGAPDTLREVCKISGKSVKDVHATCVACPHGGPKLNKKPELISISGEGGKQITSGPEFEAAKCELMKEWKAQQKRFKGGKA
jgi:hypothetical protein